MKFLQGRLLPLTVLACAAAPQAAAFSMPGWGQSAKRALLFERQEDVTSTCAVPQTFSVTSTITEDDCGELGKVKEGRAVTDKELRFSRIFCDGCA